MLVQTCLPSYEDNIAVGTLKIMPTLGDAIFGGPDSMTVTFTLKSVLRTFPTTSKILGAERCKTEFNLLGDLDTQKQLEVLNSIL
jgi:hypothetical protein